MEVEHRMTETIVPRWDRFERAFTSATDYDNPLQDATLRVTFRGPGGQERTVDGFWDGGTTWRVRFMPDTPGPWAYTTVCSDAANTGLHGHSGTFTCGEAHGAGRFGQHGPVGLAASRRHLAHADGTPFLWLADTAWNGPLRASDDEWDDYLRERVRQGFTAVQWVTTQWLAASRGDREGRVAFTGRERIAVDPAFYQRLDARLEAINRAGLLAAPVLLWAAQWSDPALNMLNPGYTLPEDQAVLLARYMVARWGAHHVVWILNGDGNYHGANAERWRRIGRAVFGGGPHAPVSLHPCGMSIPFDEFCDEAWLDIIGYQSGHGDDADTLRWLVAGPPAQLWRHDPPRPFINLEPPYEYHISYQSRQRITPAMVRRALYSSLLITPPAGVTYGGHGVWGWDDGTSPPEAHDGTGVPLPWREALRMPGAEQVAHLAALFNALDWPRLRPAPELLAAQPGEADPARFLAAARADEGDLALVYIPVDREIALQLNGLQPGLRARWFDPRTGGFAPAAAAGDGQTQRFTTPAEGDWVLVLEPDAAR
jgi:hypothetical protein